MMNEPIINTIRCDELHRLSLNVPIDLIDVRTVEEFQEIRAVGATNTPLDSLDPAAVAISRKASPADPIYFICAVGGRSAWACELMTAAGYPNVVNVEGGTQAWCLANLPIEHGT
jgi:rhodanese-related sulfurtransferase